jgi:NAD(P)-dependent dehydrogenase (short-subunit alcohol dehydrogenase family)
VRFDKNSIVVTGGLGELGFAIAEALAGRGARVTLLDRADPTERIAQLIASGGEAFGVRADVTNENEVSAAMAATAERWGGIDGLVNNAAGFIGFKSVEQTQVEEWEEIFRVDACGSFLCVRESLSWLKLSDRPRIVNIGSGSSDSGTPMLLSHLSAKGAVASMTRGLASELGAYGITVNAVIPGLFESKSTRALAPPFIWEREREKQALSDRNTDKRDVVGPVLMLLSEHAARITGQCLHVNSGSRFA